MFKKKASDIALQEQIEHTLEYMASFEPHTAQYKSCNDQLETLYRIQASNRSTKVKPDTLIMAACNMLGIGLILGHERVNVVTSKALGFVTKPRL